MTESITLPSGRQMTIKAPGSEARKAVAAALTMDERKHLKAMAPDGDVEALTRADLGPELWARWMDAEVAYVCACTVTPRLWATFPPAPTSIYWDDLEEDDWTALKTKVAELEEKKRTESKP